MRQAFLTLWDLVAGEKNPKPAVRPARTKPARRRPAPPKEERRVAKRPAPPVAALATFAPVAAIAESPSVESMEQKYERMTRELLEQHQVRVRRWRKAMSGIAWYVTYRDGRIQRLIEAPRPTGPMSAAVFCHEIGHHAIGFDVYKPRCLEEYHAWAWAIAEMERRGLNVSDRVHERMRKSLEYAVRKALRRGIKTIPLELEPYLPQGVRLVSR